MNIFNPLKSSKGIALLAVLSVVVAFHLYIIATQKSIGDEDAAAYALQARSIVAGNGLTSPVVWLHVKRYATSVHPEDYWPPLQSFFIAASNSLLGDSLFATKLPNVFAFVFIVIAVFLIGSAFFSQTIGFVAALMCLFSSDIALYSIGARNELFAILFMIASLLVMAFSLHNNKPQIKLLILGAVLSAFAFLCRSVALILPMTFAFWYCLHLVIDKNDSPLLHHIRKGLSSFAIYSIVFAAVVAPYILHNFATSKHLLPDLPSKLGVISLQAFKENPQARSINADLSHYPQMRRVYAPGTLNVNVFAKSNLRDFIRKGAHEMDILARMFKTSTICPIALLFLTLLSYFFVTPQARALLELLLIYLSGTIILIPFYQHVEQRYYIFIIPFVAIYSAAMFGWLDARISGYHFKIAFRTLIAAGIIALIVYPNVTFYRKELFSSKCVDDLNLAGTWIRNHSSKSAVVMSNSPCRMSYYSTRPAVMLPLASTDTIQEICNHYQVTYIVANSGEAVQFTDKTIAATTGSLRIIKAFAGE
jgi:4-amino-4-deoxy-L-arabinose transferase-like glycosyltransferase